MLRKLVEEKVFERYIVLGRSAGIGTVESIFDERERAIHWFAVGCKLIGIICVLGGCVTMGILRAMAIRRRVKEMQEYARVLSVATAELRYRRDILAQVFVRVAKKCRQPYAAWLSELSQALMEAQQRQAYSYTEVAADFDQIWIEHADKLYESSGLKQEDMEYIYNLGQTIGYLDVQAQEEGLALLQADLGRHIRELEAEAKDRMRLSLVVGSVAGVLLIIILI